MANLKAGTLIGGNLIWHAGILPLKPVNDNSLYYNDFKIYTEGNKPTPAEVGAVSKTGDTMTGALLIDFSGSGAARLVAANESGWIQAGMADTTQPQHMKLSGISAHALTSADFSMVGDDRLTVNGKKVYNEGHKPTAAELNVVNKSGDTMTGPLTLTTLNNTLPTTDKVKLDGYGLIGNRGVVYVTNGLSAGAISFGVGGVHNDNVKMVINSSSVNSNVDLKERGNRVYSTGNKPAPSDLGAVNKAGDTMTGKLTTPDVRITGGTLQIDHTGTESDTFITLGGTMETDASFYINNVPGDNIWGFERKGENNYNSVFYGNLYERSGNRVYSPANKPSLSDLSGSAGYLKAQDTREDNYTPDDMAATAMRGVFTNQGVPVDNIWYSKMSIKGWTNGYASWEIASQSSSSASDGKLWFRSGIDTTWQPWDMVYTTRHKPTPADVGAYPSTGGTLNGDVILKGGQLRTFNRTDNITVFGNKYAFLNGTDETWVSTNAYWDGTWKKRNNAEPSWSLALREDAQPEFNYGAGGQSNPHVSRYQIYHEGHKPTPAELQVTPETALAGYGFVHIGPPQSAVGSDYKYRWYKLIQNTSSNRIDYDIQVWVHADTNFYSACGRHNIKVTRYTDEAAGKLHVSRQTVSGNPSSMRMKVKYEDGKTTVYVASNQMWGEISAQNIGHAPFGAESLPTTLLSKEFVLDGDAELTGAIDVYPNSAYDSDSNSLKWFSSFGTVYNNSHTTWNATGTASGQGLAFNGKTAIGGANDAWLRLNPNNQFTSGIFGGSIGTLRHDGSIQCGAWGSSGSAIMRPASDIAYGADGNAAFSYIQSNSSNAHWLIGSYSGSAGSNMRSGIQVRSDSVGLTRIYTNYGANYVQIETGNLTAQNNVTAFSDIRVKKNIKKIQNALDKVLSLNGVTYDRIDQNIRQTGLIAQEVEKILPEAVITGEYGDIKDFKSVAYGNLVGLLVESIKELNKKIEKLEKMNG